MFCFSDRIDFFFLQMVLVVRNDLKMGKGKVAAQVKTESIEEKQNVVFFSVLMQR